jgi:hypothetical protein
MSQGQKRSKNLYLGDNLETVTRKTKAQSQNVIELYGLL